MSFMDDPIIEDKLPPIKQKARLNYRLHRQMQDLYTGFLEHRYTVFISLLDSFGQYRSLYEPLKPAKQKNVVWLDDVVQKQRKKQWKQFVSDLWQEYQKSFVGLLKIGTQSTPSLLSCNDSVLREVISIAKDALAAVPLPDSLVSSEEAISNLKELHQTSIFSQGIRDMLISARTDRCKPQKTASSFSTVTGVKIKSLLSDSQLTDRKKDLYAVLCQGSAWWISTKGNQLISSFKIEEFLAVRYGDIAWSHKFSVALLKVMRLQRRRNKSIQGACERLKASNLDLGAKILEDDFSFIREWLKNSEYLTTEESETLSSLPVFDYLSSGISILTDNASGSGPSQAFSMVKFYRKNKISPQAQQDYQGQTSMDSGNHSVEDILDISAFRADLPPLQQWCRIKKSQKTFRCLTFC